MVKRKEKGKKKFNKGGNALFNKSTAKPNKSCPLSGKGAPEIKLQKYQIIKKIRIRYCENSA